MAEFVKFKDVKHVARYLKARARRKAIPDRVQLQGGPWNGETIPLTTDGTLPISVGSWRGYYSRLATDQQSRRIYGSFLSNAGYRNTSRSVQLANWIPIS